MYFVKNGQGADSASKDLSVRFSVFELGKSGSSSYGIIFSKEALSQMKKTIDDEGYCDIAIEFLKSDVDGELAWQIRDSNNVVNPSSTYTIIVDEKDSKNAVLRFRGLAEDFLFGESSFDIEIKSASSTEKYSAITVMVLPSDYLIV